MRYYYAQINSEGICIGIADLSGECTDSNVIQIEFFNVDILGKKYNNGVWEDV